MATTNSNKLGPEFTKQVIDSMGPNTPPRLREVMTSFIHHMHDFAREVQLTSDEWMLAVDMINWGGKMSDEKRNEGQLMCDVIGFESYAISTVPAPLYFRSDFTSLVDDITYTAATKSINGLTASAILGPFYRQDHPIRENGSTISFDTPKDAKVVFMYGRVTDAQTGNPIPNAAVDVWQASTNGLSGLGLPHEKMLT